MLAEILTTSFTCFTMVLLGLSVGFGLIKVLES
ncbi:unnamed protein product [Chrysoparadoxa australica]